MTGQSYISEIIVGTLTLCVCILCVWAYSLMKKRRANAQKMAQIKHDFLKASDAIHAEPKKSDQSPIEFLEENEISVRDDEEDEEKIEVIEEDKPSFFAFDDDCDDECTCNPFSFQNIKCDYCVQKTKKQTSTSTSNTLIPFNQNKSQKSTLTKGQLILLAAGAVVVGVFLYAYLKQRKRR